MSMIDIKYDFFENFKTIENHFKKIPLYSGTEWGTKFQEGNKVYWPGSRSQHLAETNPFLWNLIAKELKEKYSHVMMGWQPNFMDAYTHLRLSGDDEKDSPHQDLESRFTLMVYLSDTNLESGTCFYHKIDDEHVASEPTNTVNFIKNTSVLFSGDLYHKSKHNYGTDVENGRLTLNCFIS